MKSVHAQKRDGNERSIINAMKARDVFVQQLTQGSGVADLLVGYRGLWYVMEVKDPTQTRKLTDKQILWILEIKNRAPVHVVETVDDALRIIDTP